MTDLGEFGKENNIPAGGLALAPTLGEFWPLLLRQAAGGIVVGDRLPMLERAVRHQEKGLDLALGVGYDIEEFDVVLKSSNVHDRCLEMVALYQLGRFDVANGSPVPQTDQANEGSVYIPSWAPSSPMVLDPLRATQSDRAWAAFSGGETNGLDYDEVAETAELLSAWAASRSFWNSGTRNEVQSRANSAGLYNLDLPEVEKHHVNLNKLLTPGTRVAFTGRDNLLGGPADDKRLEEICADRNLVYKSSVSKTRCDVLIAFDPASMSRKAQNAREFGKLIISQTDFEAWYESGTVPEESVDVQEKPISPPTIQQDIPEETDSADLFTSGARVAFRGTTLVNGKRYAHGEPLQALCDKLGLQYKQAVSKTRCDVLVTDDLTATDGKMMLAGRYNKPMVTQESFSTWAAERLLQPADGHSPVLEYNQIAASVPDDPEEVNEYLTDGSGKSSKIFEPPVHGEYGADPLPTASGSNPFTPSSTFNQADHQPYAASAYFPYTNPVSANSSDQQVAKKPNKSARRLIRSLAGVVLTFILIVVFASVDMIPLGAISMLAMFVFIGLSLIFGILAIVEHFKEI